MVHWWVLWFTVAGWRNDRWALTAAWQWCSSSSSSSSSSSCFFFFFRLRCFSALAFSCFAADTVASCSSLCGCCFLLLLCARSSSMFLWSNKPVCSNCFEEVCVLNGLIDWLIDHTLHSSLVGALVLQHLLLRCAILSVVFLVPAAVLQGVAHPPGTVFLSLYALLKFESPNSNVVFCFQLCFCLLQTAPLMHLLLRWLMCSHPWCRRRTT